jgi:hypothetical protein
MEKKIMLFTIAIAIVIVAYSFREIGLNSNSNSKPAVENELYSAYKTPESEPNKVNKSEKSTQLYEEKPGILLMLSNDTGLTKWSPALWWNYHHAKKGQPGC